MVLHFLCRLTVPIFNQRNEFWFMEWDHESVDEVLVVTASALVLIGAGMVLMDAGESSPETSATGNNFESASGGLTDYQKAYVDCPEEYLYHCTKLSKIPTEEVTFQRVENGKIFLGLDDGRTMVGELVDDGHDVKFAEFRQ